MNLWRKLNHLVPEPQCRTANNQIIAWTDSRTQPTQTEIDAVTDADMVSSELDTEANNALSISKIERLLFEINFDQENRLRVLEGGAAITKTQYKNALVTKYKAL